MGSSCFLYSVLSLRYYLANTIRSCGVAKRMDEEKRRSIVLLATLPFAPFLGRLATPPAVANVNLHDDLIMVNGWILHRSDLKDQLPE